MTPMELEVYTFLKIELYMPRMLCLDKMSYEIVLHSKGCFV